MTGHEGPTIRRIPEQVYNTCTGCKWYKHQLVRSGRDPVYIDSCHHPVWTERRYNMFQEESMRLIEGSETPVWCPVVGIIEQTKEQ
jgi:hypothetical protein